MNVKDADTTKREFYLEIPEDSLTAIFSVTVKERNGTVFSFPAREDLPYGRLEHQIACTRQHFSRIAEDIIVRTAITRMNRYLEELAVAYEKERRQKVQRESKTSSTPRISSSAARSASA